MSGDITRNTFDRSKHFSSLYKQQGRVELDSDFNEAMDILVHHQRAVAADLIGQHGTPPIKDGSEDGGFQISMDGASDFKIGMGHYYVDGILCENDGKKDEDRNWVDLTYKIQPDYPQAPDLPPAPFLVYLDVWERHITALEDDDIREKALGGPDTATRKKTVWQVKVEPDIDACPEGEQWKTLVEKWRPKNRGQLKAMAGEPDSADLDNPCIISPEARYRGPENQLYRIEIHKGGKTGEATFKWSRDNGSNIFPVRNLAGNEVSLGYLGRDQGHSLAPGQWVELVDDYIALSGDVKPLGKVKLVNHEQLTITVEWPEGASLPTYADDEEYTSKHVLIRRWDHSDAASGPGVPRFDIATGTLLIEESTDANTDNWLALEDGIRISFTKSINDEYYYCSGDYWLIRACTATCNIEWPSQKNELGQTVMENNRPKPEKLPPQGVKHHYAPLAVILVTNGNQADESNQDCRRQITSVIDSNTDLQVHNILVGGSLSVSEDASLNSKVSIGSIAPRNPLAIRAQGASQELISFEEPGGITKWHINQNLGGNNPGLNFVETGVADGRIFLQAGGNVGIGTTTPKYGLDVSSSTIKLGLERNGGGQLVITNNTNDNKVYLEAWSQDESTSAAEFVLCGKFIENVPQLSLIAANTFINGDVQVNGVVRGKGFQGPKIGYVTDQFVNNIGEALEEGDVVVIRDNPIDLFYGVNNDIPVLEVDLAQKEYDTLVCGIVCEVYGELTPQSSLADNPRSKAKGKKDKSVDKQISDVGMRIFESEELANRNRSRVEPGQIGGMVTLGTYAYCKVDADIAAIQVGDLLTTSPTKGHAQKVLDRSQAIGAIIGKALGSLEKGKGKIPVLVMLQ